jgi:hypothetical protein
MARGQLLNTGAGFFIAKGLVVTAFQVIDGASTLRVGTLGGKTVEVKDVAAWNRRQGLGDPRRIEFGSAHRLPLLVQVHRMWATGATF